MNSPSSPPKAEPSDPIESRHAAIALEYARDVVAGKILACKWVKLACRRHLDDLERAKSPDYPYAFDEAKAGRICRFLEQLPHTKGDWAVSVGGRDNRIRLEPWQCFIFCAIFGWVLKSTGLRRYRIAYVCIPRKNGKALGLDTPVLTPSGWSTVRELRMGDYVFGPDGAPRKILATTEVLHGRPCYELKFSDGESIVADAEHQWLTDARVDRDNKKGVRGKTAGPKPRVKTTAEIAATLLCRREFNHRIAVASPVQMPEKNLPIHPYVLGVWLGDGHSRSGALTIGIQDAPETIRNVEAAGEPIVRNGYAGPYAYRLSSGDRSQKARNVSFAARLRRLDLIENKHIPDAYLFASESQRMALLQGLMDADGSISKAGQCEFSTTSADLRDGIIELLRGLGFKPSYITRPAMLRGKDCGPVYRLQFWAPDHRPVFRLTRKAARQRKLATRSSYRQIVSCQLVESIPVKCIQVDAEDGLFLAGRSLVTTHNSILAAGTGLYMLANDAEYGAEVYAGATCKRQAWEVFRPAKLMVQRTPRLKEVFGIHVGAQTIAVLENGSRFEPVVRQPGDGASPSCAIVDEYHEHKTDELVDTMRTGMGARKQPLLWIITTAGANIAGPCHGLQRDVEKLLEGSIQRDELFGVIYTVDEADDWTSLEALKKANPNFGVSVFEDYLLQQQNAAVQSARKQNVFLTKHLNLWVGAATAWMNAQRWKALADPALDPNEFLGLPCFAAADLSSKLDITAIAHVFVKRIENADHYYAFFRFYLPAERANDPELLQYRAWAQEGFLKTTPGNVIDYDAIAEETIADVEKYRVQQFGFDPWNAEHFAQKIGRATPAEIVEIPQLVRTLSEPMKQLEALVIDGRLHHDGNPVMTWMMSNVVAHLDAKDNIYPRKEKNELKIDGPVALIMALSRALVQEDNAITYTGLRSIG